MHRVSPARHILLMGAAAVALVLAAGCSSDRRWANEWQEIVGGGLGTEELIQASEAFLLEDPPLRYASEARFTIGFAWAEGLERFGEARRWFTELLEEDPEGGWAEEARWMLENMEKDVDEILPDLEELEQAIPPASDKETPPGR